MVLVTRTYCSSVNYNKILVPINLNKYRRYNIFHKFTIHQWSELQLTRYHFNRYYIILSSLLLFCSNAITFIFLPCALLPAIALSVFSLGFHYIERVRAIMVLSQTICKFSYSPWCYLAHPFYTVRTVDLRRW